MSKKDKNAPLDGQTPQEQPGEVTEEYRQAALTSEGNPFQRLGGDFAEMFLIVGERLSGR